MVFCNWSHLVTCWCDVKLLNCWENKSIVARKSFQTVVRPDFACAVGGNLWIIYFMHHCKATCDSLLWKMRPWLKWWVHLSGDAFSPQVPPHEHQLWFKKNPISTSSPGTWWWTSYHSIVLRTHYSPWLQNWQLCTHIEMCICVADFH